nr:xylulose kinase-1 [Tanacetum cinerariifolium]
MVAYLTKSDASEAFNQIVDFLNGSSIKYALTVNPNIYVSCIKQFWTTVAVKKVNDVIRLQALVDRKKVVVTEATIREVLHLDDAEGVECLPNEEIFAELARMGYEKLSTKLTFYKAFFSSKCRKFNFSKYIFDSLVRNVDSPSKFYMYPYFLQLTIRKQVGDLSTHTTKYTSPSLTQKVFANMRRACKGFFGVETPLFEGMLVEQQVVEEGDAKVHGEEVNAGDAAEGDGMLVEQQVVEEGDAKVHGEEVNAGDAAEGDVSAANDKVPTVDEEPSIPSPTPPTPPPQPSQDIPSTSQKLERRNKVKELKLRRLQKVGTTQRIDSSDETVMDDVSNQERMIAEMDQDADVVLEDDKEVVDAVKNVQDDIDESAHDQERKAKSQTEIYKIDLEHANKVLSMKEDEYEPAEDKGKGIMVEEPKPLKKQQQIEQDEKYARELEAELNKNIDWDEAIDHTEAQARKNMMVYLKNVAGFKMDYFKGMSYDDIRLIFERYFDSNVAFLQNTKEQIEEEESRALKRLNKEDLEVLWSLVKERFFTTKPKNFFDDFLLMTLGAMFEKPNIHAQIWKNKRSVHGPAKVKGWKLLESCGVQIITFTTTLLILLVEKKYPLTRFTLDQMLNAVRIEVEEESEVSLELLKFTRQQHQEGQLE